MFYEVLPWYLAIGMTYKQFWEDDPYLAVVYRKRHKLLREEKNQQLWMQGLYNHIAFRAVISAFLTKHPEQYCEKPILLSKTAEGRKRTQEEQVEEVVAVLNQLSAMYKNTEK